MSIWLYIFTLKHNDKIKIQTKNAHDNKLVTDKLDVSLKYIRNYFLQLKSKLQAYC